MRSRITALSMTALALLILSSPLPTAVPSGRSARKPAQPSQNLVGIHDPQSSAYDSRCLSCHSDVLTEKTLDPRVPHVHKRMIPYTPGYNPKRGATNEVCVQCHRSTDVRQGSGAGLRVQVDREICALCHGPSGPAKVLYR